MSDDNKREAPHQSSGNQYGAAGAESSRALPLHFALSYAHAGMTVMPLGRRSNRPHHMLGRGWSRDTVGSNDLSQIREWWRADPAANVGIVNGPRSGLLIVDVDRKPGKHDGLASLWALQAELGEQLPDTCTVETPSGGRHLYFRLPHGEDVPVPKGWLPAVELTWQVAAPPSCRAVTMGDSSLRDSETVYLPYEWADRRDLASAPDWLLHDIRTRPAVSFGGSPAATGRHGGGDGDLPPTEWFVQNGLGGWSGSRNIDCHRLACRLWRHHWPHDDLVTQLIYDAWAASDQTDFPWTEAMACIRSAREYVVPQVAVERAWIDELRSTL